ncbi:hypothetical protein Taitung203_09540 [Helicobacter pylori]
MEKLFEKILHEMRSGISFALAFVFSLIVSIVNPKGVFQFIFEFIFQYTQNKIFSFSFSFFFIFLFFYAIFTVGYRACLWFKAKKYEQDLIDQKDKEIALKKRSILKKRQMAIPIRSAASTFKKFLKIKKFFKTIILKIELL